jgi:hypothetical protein
MTNYLSQVLSNDSNKSSARLINFAGAILGAGLLAYDTGIHGGLNSTNFGLFLGYCGTGFVASKALDKVGQNATNTTE